MTGDSFGGTPSLGCPAWSAFKETGSGPLRVHALKASPIYEVSGWVLAKAGTPKPPGILRSSDRPLTLSHQYCLFFLPPPP